MKDYNEFLISIVPYEQIQAPFMEYDKNVVGKLKRMGVIDDEEVPFEIPLVILAATFASNFYDALIAGFIDNEDALYGFFGALDEIWEQVDLTGIYYYIILNCSLLDYPVPKEFLLISRREDILLEYMDNFIKIIDKLKLGENKIEPTLALVGEPKETEGK